MDSLSAEAFVVTLNEYQKIYLEHKLSDAVNKLVQDFNTDFGYDSLKIRAKSTQGLESLKQFAHELQLKLKGIAEFSPPEITDDMNSFLADTAEGQQKSRIEIISDQLGLLIYAGKIYATQDQFDSFVSKINLEYANKNNDAEKDRIEETKQELEPIEQLKPQESQKPKYVAIRILSHCLKMIFAPFYYPLVLQALQTDFEIKLQDELEVDHEGVAIRKKDSEMSI